MKARGELQIKEFPLDNTPHDHWITISVREWTLQSSEPLLSMTLLYAPMTLRFLPVFTNFAIQHSKTPWHSIPIPLIYPSPK